MFTVNTKLRHDTGRLKQKTFPRHLHSECRLQGRLFSVSDGLLVYGFTAGARLLRVRLF